MRLVFARSAPASKRCILCAIALTIAESKGGLATKAPAVGSKVKNEPSEPKGVSTSAAAASKAGRWWVDG